MNSALEKLGWNELWAAKIDGAESACAIGRVSFESHGIYHVMTSADEIWMAELKGILRKGAGARDEFPNVGDWVLMEPQGDKRAIIVRVLPRENALIRREQSRGEASRRASTLQILAANIDWVLITSSANEEWNLRRLERYLGVVAEAALKPALLLTKIDLSADRGEAIAAEARKVSANLPILRVNAPAGEGLAGLKALLGAQGTAVLMGSSGVGKSSIVNALLGRQEMATFDVREKDQRGRHTTVGRHLMLLPWGGCLIDSPGLRDLGLNDEAAIADSFDDIAALAPHCRFGDCRHEVEPGCAVQGAFKAGELDAVRLEAFLKLQTETHQAARRTQIANRGKKSH